MKAGRKKQTCVVYPVFQEILSQSRYCMYQSKKEEKNTINDINKFKNIMPADQPFAHHPINK